MHTGIKAPYKRNGERRRRIGNGIESCKNGADEKAGVHHHHAARFPAWGLGGVGTSRTKTTDPLNRLGWAPRLSGLHGARIVVAR